LHAKESNVIRDLFVAHAPSQFWNAIIVVTYMKDARKWEDN
jgi:hypothetical protein